MKPMRQTLVIPLTLLLLSACAGNVAPTTQIDDAVVAQHVRDAIQGDAELTGQQITVSASRGTVILTGVVRSREQVDRAERITRTVEGVSLVENRLAIR